MSVTRTALLIGLFLGFVAAFGTFGDVLLVLLFGAVGLVVGGMIEGKIDVRQLMGRGDR